MILGPYESFSPDHMGKQSPNYLLRLRYFCCHGYSNIHKVMRRSCFSKTSLIQSCTCEIASLCLSFPSLALVILTMNTRGRHYWTAQHLLTWCWRATFNQGAVKGKETLNIVFIGCWGPIIFILMVPKICSLQCPSLKGPLTKLWIWQVGTESWYLMSHRYQRQWNL